jgi:UPF0716 protein FxsA
LITSEGLSFGLDYALHCPYVGAGSGEVYLAKVIATDWSDNMWVLLTILAVPLIEIGLFVTIGGAIGLWATLAWVIAAVALGLVVLKGIAETGSVSLSQDMVEMRDPLSPIAHRAMVALAGGLLILPGFLTDFIGVLLLIPPIRSLILKLVAKRLSRGVVVMRSEVIEGDWRDITPDNTNKPVTPPRD